MVVKITSSTRPKIEGANQGGGGGGGGGGMRKIWSGLTYSRAHCWWCAHAHSLARGLRSNAFAPPNACFGAYFCKYLGGLLELRALIYTGFKNFTAVPTFLISESS